MTASEYSAGFTRQPAPRAWWALAVLGVAQLMIVVDTTIVATALPSAQYDLGFSDDDRQWVVSAYALAFGSLLLIGGKVTDRIGRRRALIIALAGFATASAAAGAAPNIALLLAARAGQGAFAAVLAPAILSSIATLFEHRPDRSRAFGVFGAIGGGGAALGLLLGGALTDTVGWRWTMYVNIAFAVVAIIGTKLVVPRFPAVPAARIAVASASLICIGLFAVVAGVSRAETDGWTDRATLGLLAGGAAFVVAFAVLQSHQKQPLLPLRVVTDRDRAGGLVALFTGVSGMLGAFLLLTYFMQSALGYSALECGLAFLPLSGSVMVVAGASGALGARIPVRVLLPLGLVLGAVALLWLTRLGEDVSYVRDLLPSMVLLGAGLGVVYGVGIELGVRRLQASDAGVGSSVVNSVQQIGASLGAALFSTISVSVAIHRTLDGAPAAAAALAGSSAAFTVGAVVFGVGALLAFICIRHSPILPEASGADA